MAGTIVYVDTELDLPQGLASELGRLGFRLEHTADVEEALSLAREGRTRLLMLEVLIEGGVGWQLIQRVRRLSGPPGEVPIIVLTRGERTPELYGRAVELGANDFLARPVMRAEVLGAILECVEASDAAPPIEAIRVGDGDDASAESSGALVEFPLPELLLQLRNEGATGVLSLQDFEAIAVQLRNGSPIGLASSRGNETFADFLVRTKRISGGEHDALLERVHTSGENEPKAAVALGVLSRAEARSALAARAVEPLLEAFAWSTGSWRFERGRRLGSGMALEHDSVRMLVEGVLQWSPSRSIRAMLDRRGALYLSKVERPPYALVDLSPLPCEPEILDDWVGDETVAAVLESGVIGERELYALFVAGLVEGRAESLLELHEVIAEPTPVPEEEPVLLLEQEEPPETAVTEQPTAPEHRPPEAPQLEEPTTPVAESSVEPAAADAAEAAPDETSDADRPREAERHFREGENHLIAKRYSKAVESFGMSAHLDPDQGEYRAHLGYAMHLQNPKDELVRREALEHVAKGVKLASQSWKPMLYLARVFIASGEHRNARKVLGTAIRQHPDCVPLNEEVQRLRRLEAASEPPGLMARVRGWLGK